MLNSPVASPTADTSWKRATSAVRTAWKRCGLTRTSSADTSQCDARFFCTGSLDHRRGIDEAQTFPYAAGPAHANTALLSASEYLHQPVEIFLSLVERFHHHAFVPAVRAVLSDFVGKSGVPVGRYSGIAQITSIGCTSHHRRNDGRSRPKFSR